MQKNKLLFVCLLSVSMFSTSCFSMLSTEKQAAREKFLQQARLIEEKGSLTYEVTPEEQKILNEKLLDAAYDGDEQLVAALLILRAEINCQHKTRNTSLHFATYGKHVKVVKILLANKARTDIKNCFGETALHLVVRKCYIKDNLEKTKQIIMLLLAHQADVNALNGNGRTAYDCAVLNKYGVDILKMLRAQTSEGLQAQRRVLQLAQQVDGLTLDSIQKQDEEKGEEQDEEEDEEGFTYTLNSEEQKIVDAQLIAATQKKSANQAQAQAQAIAVAMLLDLGANVNCQNDTGFRPLHFAAQWNNPAVARLLLSRGAIVDCQHYAGFTPLHLAAYWGHIEIVRILLVNKARTDIENCLGKTALHEACCSYTIKNHLEETKQIITLLQFHKADVNALSKENKTAYDYAIRHKYKEDILKMLIPSPKKPLVSSGVVE